MRWVIVGLAMAAVARMAVADDAKKAGDAKALLGTWQLTKGVIGGHAFPQEAAKKIRLDLTKGQYRVTGAESPDEGTWEARPRKKPQQMDVHGTDGPNKGKTFLAIYTLSGDRLIICYDLSGKARPTKFESAPKTLLFLAVYTRLKQ